MVVDEAKTDILLDQGVMSILCACVGWWVWGGWKEIAGFYWVELVAYPSEFLGGRGWVWLLHAPWFLADSEGGREGSSSLTSGITSTD